MKTRLIAILLLLPLFALNASAQTAANDSLAQVSILTAGPGNEVYQLDGHTGLRIKYSDNPYDDLTVNWGVFDFQTPNFVYRFVKGETDYLCGMVYTQHFVGQYIDEGRWVKEQPLNLTPAETARLVALVRENLRPENRVYRYNYVKDNCSTRVLQIVKRSIDSDSAHIEIRHPDPGTSFRDEMAYNHRNYPWYQFGIDLALGNGIDYPVTAEENTFSPLYLCQLAPDIVVVEADGTERPLICGTQTIVSQTAPEPRQGGIPPMPVAIGVLLLAILTAALTRRMPRTAKCVYAVVYTLYGIGGLVLTFLIFISVHEATSINANYLWLNPLSLIVPLCIWTKRGKYLVYIYQIVNFALLICYPIVALAINQNINPLFIPLVAANLILSFNYLSAYCRNR